MTILVASAAGLAAQGPIVRDREVTFVVASDRSDPPRIVGDFNGWAGGEMSPSADGRTFTLRTTLDPAARVEYLIAFRDRFERDPGNPRSVPAPAGPPRSELLMPGYRLPVPLAEPQRRGTIETLPFVSRTGERRRIRVFVPANPESRVPIPVLYVHDGDIVLDKLALPTLLDALIDRGQISPVLAVFIDAVDRHDDYEPGSPFRMVLINEIVPAIERR